MVYKGNSRSKIPDQATIKESERWKLSIEHEISARYYNL